MEEKIYNNENLIDEVAKEVKESKSGINSIAMIGIGALGALVLTKVGLDAVKKLASKSKHKAPENDPDPEIEDLPPIDDDDPVE